MEYFYRHFEPDQGLEDIQAQIFNQANNRNVTGQEIRERFDREKIDPKTVMYAFNADQKPLAYVQARDYPQRGEVHLGYPWKMPGCPIEVQKRMFSDLLAHLKGRDSDLKIRSNIVDDPPFIEFVKAQGFIEDQRVIQFTIDLESIAKVDVEALPYTLRQATAEDIPAIKHAYFRALGDLARQDDANFHKFVTGCIETGFTSVVVRNEKLVGVCTNRVPTAEQQQLPDQFVGLQFFFTLVGEEAAIPVLMGNAITIAIREWGQDTIRIGFTDENPAEIANLKKIAKAAIVTQTQFRLP